MARIRLLLTAVLLVGTTLVGASSTAGGAVEEFSIPTAGADAFDIVAAPDGSVWFTERGPGSIGGVARISAEGTITEFTVPPGNSSLHHPTAITIGPDCRPWFTDEGYAGLGRIATDGTITSVGPGLVGGTQAVYSRLPGIATGQDGGLWLVGTRPMYGDFMNRLSTTGATWGLNTTFAGPDDIASDGDRVWITERGGGSLARLSLDEPVTRIALPEGWAPRGITQGPDGAMWFVDWAGGRIGRVASGGGFSEFALPSGSRPVRIAAGADNALWFTDEGRNSIGRMTTGGALTEYSVPTPAAGLRGITSGTDAVWFVEAGANKIGRIALPASSPGSATAGPDFAAPETTARLEPDVPLKPWSNASVSVGLNARDRSGVAALTYSTTGADVRAPVTATQTSACADVTFTVEAEGTTVVHYEASDTLGNATPSRTRTVRIDTTPPTTTMNPAQARLPVGLGAVFSGTAHDNASGVLSVTVHLDAAVGRDLSRRADCIAGCGTSDAVWEVHLAPLEIPAGMYDVTAAATDVAGTTGPSTPPVRVLIV